MQVEVPVIVQHHPARRHLLPALLERLATDAVQVVADPQPDSLFRSSWRTYRACLEAFPDNAEHALIIQDDAAPCRDLVAALPAIIEAAEIFTGGDDPLITLSPFHAVPEWFVEKARGMQMEPGLRDLQPPEEPPAVFVPVLAAIWPRAAARDALLAVAPLAYMGHGTLPDAPNPPLVRREGRNAFVFMQVDDDAVGPDDLTVELGRLDISDERAIHEFGRAVLPRVVGILPALVAHHDHVPSLRYPRATPETRRTAFYIGDDCSALEVLSSLAQQEVAA